VVPVKVLITRANKHLSPTLAFTVCLNPSEGTLLEDWIKKRINQGGIEKFTNQNMEIIYRGWNDSRVNIHTYSMNQSVSSTRSIALCCLLISTQVNKWVLLILFIIQYILLGVAMIIIIKIIIEGVCGIRP